MNKKTQKMGNKRKKNTKKMVKKQRRSIFQTKLKPEFEGLTPSQI